MELLHQTPFHEEVSAKYDPSKERIVLQRYNNDLAVKVLTKVNMNQII